MLPLWCKIFATLLTFPSIFVSKDNRQNCSIKQLNFPHNLRSLSTTMGNPPTDDAVTALKIHNDVRAGKNLTPLVWDDNLSHQATEYAKQLASNNTLQHSDDAARPNQGENLYMESGLTNPASAAAQSWINESANYHGEKIGDGNFGSYAHFSESPPPPILHVDVENRTLTSHSSSVYVVKHD